MDQDNNKWHQKWWGVIILLFFVLAVVYTGAFLYEAVAYFEDEIYQNNTYDDPNFNFAADSSPIDQSIRKTAITNDDPYLGSDNAAVTIVVFADFQCPYCKMNSTVLSKIGQDYNQDLKIIYRDFPNISAHQEAVFAALAAECADEQGMFWQFYDYIYENQDIIDQLDYKQYAADLGLLTDMYNDCIDNDRFGFEIINDLQDGYELKVSGTPTYFIFGPKSNLRIAGTIEYDDFKRIVESFIYEKTLQDLNN